MATLFPYGFADPPGANYPSTTPVDARKYTQRKPRVAEYLYQFDGTEEAADIIRLPFNGPNGKWPKGIVVDPNRSEVFVESDAMVSGTLDVGDLDTKADEAAYPNGDAYDVQHVNSDADRYADGLDIGAVGRDAFADGVAASIPHELQEACFLTATLATLSTPSATGVLRIRVAYFDV